MEWKWSIAEREKHEKTPRHIQKREIQQEQQQEQALSPNLETSAFYQSLMSDNDAWSQPMISQESTIELNKRENVYNKMNEREMIGQRGMNPFMTNQSYINDIVTQDHFLKPASTTREPTNKNVESAL